MVVRIAKRLDALCAGWSYVSPITWTIIARFLGETSVSTNMIDCHVPNSTVPLTMGKVLSGGSSIDRKWLWALDG